jgi:hypothetical protein
MRRNKLCVSFIIFIFSVLSLTSYASAQCGDCDDKNPCTMDLCDAMICQHTPQSCDDANSSALELSGKDADISTAQREGSRQNRQEHYVLKEAVNIPVSCDDNNPCTIDSYGANGCVHDSVNCDDGNASTTDVCGSSGCVHTPLLGESSNAHSVEFLSLVLPEKEAANISTSCDDNNPCTRDSYGANGCVHDPVNCDDGNAGTTDLCGPSGCVNTPLPGESYSVEFLSPVLPEIKNEVAKENTTINGSQIVMEEAIAPPINGGSIISENSSNSPSSNNSTVLSSDEALMASHHPRCEDMNCDDGNPNTFDYCYGGVCYNTTTSCDDGKPCTIDSYNGTACVHTPKNCDDHNACTIDTCVNGNCVHTSRDCDDGKPCTYDKCDPKRGCFYPSKCNDGNPCTVDYCDSAGRCLHSPVVCERGKTCIDGVCRYPYYTYPALYYPYYPYYEPYVAPTTTLPSAKSYTIPVGTAITMPWAKSVTALNTLKVENGIAYPGASPLKFVRSLGLEDQAVSGYQTGPSISERAEMIGLSWKDDGFTLTLIQPNGSILPVQGDNRNVMHLVGSNYDYYFLRSAAIGNWGLEVKPINPGANGVGFSLITGLVKGAVPLNQP